MDLASMAGSLSGTLRDIAANASAGGLPPDDAS
jgi:hypothetical protein